MCRFYLLFAVLILTTAQLVAVVQPVDLLLRNGNIYTVEDKAPHAQAVAIKADRIVFVGSDEAARAYTGTSTRVIDLRGKTVVPGFTDSHYHIFGVGERERTLNLEGITSREEFLAKIRERTGQTPPGEWITGRGWIETFWKPPVFPTRSELDQVAPDNPVFFTRADGHGAVANSAAFKIAGLTKETPDPFGGKIVKEKKTGEPSGMLLDNAMELVKKKIPPPTAAEKEQAFLAGVARSIRLGWCEIQNAGSYLDEIELMRKLYAAGRVKLRIYNAAYGPGAPAEWLLKNGPIFDTEHHRFTTRTIKVIFDGSLGSRSAALLQPYSDAPDTSGFLTEKESDLRPMFREALRRGIQVETHAIGDRANRTILNLYEEAFKAVPKSERKIAEPRWRVEHAQILAPDDIPRFAALGVIASMQPSHAISDLFFAPSRLGMKRLAGAYAWQSLLKSGAVVVAGSDAPVERGEPMIEFYAAVARKSVNGFSGPGWHPEQAVTREQALRMLTFWPAYAAFQEQEKGSIAAGKLADLTVLSQDIMKIDAPAILQTRCLMTIIGGEIVFNETAP